MVEGMGASQGKPGVRTTSFIKRSRDGILASIKKKRTFEEVHEKILIKYSVSESICPWDRKAAGAEVPQFTQGSSLLYGLLQERKHTLL